MPPRAVILARCGRGPTRSGWMPGGRRSKLPAPPRSRGHRRALGVAETCCPMGSAPRRRRGPPRSLAWDRAPVPRRTARDSSRRGSAGGARASRCAMRRPKGRPRRAPPAARGRRLPSAPAAAGRRRGAVAGPLPGAGAARGPAKRPRAAACSASRTGRRSSCAGPTSSPRWSASTQGCGGTRRSSAGESALGDPCRRSRSPASSRRRMRRAACCSSSSP
mmetsp:Transcript_1682/g.3934  ORF Transcript_1682/g.3934 Transcript_1682/m.3934 type:complete len:220 (-) Transcript_1682:270-929(-)